MLEDCMPARIKCDGHAVAPDQVPHKQEVASRVLQLTEQGVGDTTCCVVHCQRESELWSIFSQPPMVAAVYLDEHTFTSHSSPPSAMLRGPAATWTGHTCVSEYITQGVASHVYAFVLSQQPAKVGMVDSCVPSACQ